MSSSFVSDHPWMTFFLGYVAIRTVGGIFGDRSRTTVALTPQRMPSPATGAAFPWEARSRHPWLSAPGRDAVAVMDLGPAHVRFGSVPFRVFAGRPIVIVPPAASLGVLQAPGFWTNNPSILSPTTLATGEPGFVALRAGSATVSGVYRNDEGANFEASVVIEVVDPAVATGGSPMPAGGQRGPWGSGVQAGADFIAPTRVKFGTVVYPAILGRLVSVAPPPASLGALLPPGLSSSNEEILAPSTLPNGDRGFMAKREGFATLSGMYSTGEAAPFKATVMVQVVEA
ncbi:MAG: hypothetical protein ACHREM_04670 [Polyangiales bacterium]